MIENTSAQPHRRGGARANSGMKKGTILVQKRRLCYSFSATADTYEKIKQAAEMQSLSISEFVGLAALEKSDRVLRK